MIWFSAESALISIRTSACGPITIPATRKIATSGILILCATNAASVPIARISPHDSSVCWATSIEGDDSMLAIMRSEMERRNRDCADSTAAAHTSAVLAPPDSLAQKIPVTRTARLFPDGSAQPLEPGGDLACGDIGLRQEFAHREEAVELAGEVAIGHGHAGFLQPCGIFVAFVAQR